MEAATQNEQILVIKFKEAKEKLDSLKEQTSQAQKEFDIVESNLVEMLQAENKAATARYDNLGYCVLSKPRVFANCTIENLPTLFKYLRARKRGDLIRKTVNPASLSSFVKELLDNSKQIPPFIGYYLKTSVRYYNKGD